MITIGTNGYVTVDEYKAWADARQVNYFDYNDLQIEAAIIIACEDFIDANYTFIGDKVDKDQPMSLPTKDVAIANVTNPVCQVVSLQLTGKLFIDADANASGEVIAKREKVGQIEREFEYSEGSSKTYTNSTSRIDRLMKPFTIGGTGGIGLLRG